MKNLIVTSLILVCGISLSACDSGGSGSAAQNMPVGGTPFNGVFTPGIGNVTSLGNSCNFAQSSENLIFTVAESTPTSFIDITSFSTSQTIFSGTFNNPVNQNQTCFTGNIQYSQCGNAQSGTIKLVGCSVYLSGAQYIFSSQYYLYSALGNLLTTGTVNATK